MSDKPHEWGTEHFCGADAHKLMYESTAGAALLSEHGFPVQMHNNPVPKTFCSKCLCWFDDPALDQPTGSDTRSPQKGTTND